MRWFICSEYTPLTGTEKLSKRYPEHILIHRSFGSRNKLKTWILRHLVTSSGDPDLMAKAIALHHEGENMNGVGSASKGAIGLESFISGRVSRSKTDRYCRPGSHDPSPARYGCKVILAGILKNIANPIKCRRPLNPVRLFAW